MKQPDSSYLVGIALCCLFAAGCSDSKATAKEGQPQTSAPVAMPEKKHLNINILIDLSNRIDPQRNQLQPNQQERDKYIIQQFVSRFKANVNEMGSFQAKAKLRVFFHPEPNDPTIATAAARLNASCLSGNTAEAVKHNKLLYKEIENNFSTGLETIYQTALRQGSYPGSNIWRFMKDDVKVQCVEDSRQFRNILIILTDGYLYHQNDKTRDGNRYSYFERNFEHFTRFRKSGTLQNEFDQQDFGIVKATEGLDDLEVMVMEVSPEESHPVDFDIMKRYWDKWLKEMGVKHYGIFKTQQPAYTQKVIDDFLNEKQ